MDITSFLKDYNGMEVKEYTHAFNSFSVEDRLKILKLFPNDLERQKFIDHIRDQAVRDFWTHERELIEKGKCTRDWTPEQIENIYALSDKTGNMSINGGTPKIGDIEGHHMLNVYDHPEYAGDWRNIQPLEYTEHRFGAHNGNTKSPTYGYYDLELSIILDTFISNKFHAARFNPP